VAIVSGSRGKTAVEVRNAAAVRAGAMEPLRGDADAPSVRGDRLVAAPLRQDEGLGVGVVGVGGVGHRVAAEAGDGVLEALDGGEEVGELVAGLVAGERDLAVAQAAGDLLSDGVALEGAGVGAGHVGISARDASKCSSLVPGTAAAVAS
jgi:hypothetical protein